MPKIKQLSFEFIEERKKFADNDTLDVAYRELSRCYGNEEIVLDRLTPYCQSYLDKSFNRNSGRASGQQYQILNALVINSVPMTLTEISEGTFHDRNSIASSLINMCKKGILTNENGKYFFSSDPLFKWMSFKNQRIAA